MKQILIIIVFFVKLSSIAQTSEKHINLYKNAADSVLYVHTGISKHEIVRQSVPDALNALSDSDRESICINLTIATKHTFLSNNKMYKNALGHRLYIFEYKTPEDVLAAYKVLVKAGEYESGPPPGLTYTNDYLCIKGNTMYWINTACMYSFDNHKKLIAAFRKIFEINSRELLCQCGGFCKEI